MKINQLLSISLMGVGLAHALHTQADDKIWNVQTGEFTNPSNWTGGLPGVLDVAIVANGGTSTVPATANIEFGSLRLGPTEGSGESGHVIMNGGTLRIAQEAGNPKALIGFSGTLSTFIMNGGTIFFDAPEQGFLSSSYHGASELDWEVGERGVGRFEMHGDAKFYASDDLKVAENALGDGTVIIDGNAFVAVGSGISVSGGGASKEQTMVIGGNARVDSGNSMGAGNPQGGTDEGYLTMAFGGSSGKLTIQDNAVLNIRRLSAREGNSTIIVKDHGQFHIFDVLNGTGENAANRPAETGPNSSFVSGAPGTGTFTLQDDAVMTVNSMPGGGPITGLAIAGPRDNGNPSGTARFIIRDRASFRVEQDLGIGNGFNPETSDGTLEVRGPDADISIGMNLNLATDTFGQVVATDAEFNPVPGKATLEAVITGATHSTVNVDGVANIAFGRLKVRTDGHTPTAGTSYTLIKGGTINGQFAQTDFTEAPLADGVAWKVEYTADSVVLTAFEQPGLPKRPENNGATPKTDTIYVNTPDGLNNGSTESLGLAIASNGNIIVGWEDDADEEVITYLGSVWTMLDQNGQFVTPPTAQPSTAFGQTITNRFLSYFRSDGSAVPGFTSWGPKIKANLFGDGVGMGATSYALSLEVPEIGAVENTAAGENAGDHPTVQLLTSSGQPIRIVSGVSDAYAERAGDIRIGDWDYLSNGNILIVGESRQRDDLVDIYGGAGPAIHAIFRIVSTNGTEVKGVTLASSEPVGNEIWHGSAVLSNSFAIRMGLSGGGGTIRLFNNDGTPITDNIALADRTGLPQNSAGGRGEGIAFVGNGRDAYVLAVGGADDQGVPSVWVTVLNAAGSVRYSKKVTDDVQILSPGRVHAAIDEMGRVFVAYDAQLPFDDGSGAVTNPRIIMGRALDPAGAPLGGTFYVSENELPAVGTPTGQRPRVALRNGVAAVAWESLSGGSDLRTVAVRIFSLGAPAADDLVLDIEQAGPNSLRLGWTGGSGPFLVQRKTSFTDAQWMNVLTTSARTALVPNDGGTGFFRVMNNATTTVLPMSTVLGGAFEKPAAITSPGIGRGTVSLEGNTLAFDVKYSGLTSDVSNMHIHGFSSTAESSGVMVGVLSFNQPSGGTAGRIAGSVTLTEDQRTRVLAGDTYFNIHTTANGGGEIRGQITPSILRAAMNGANEKPNAVDTPATGTGTFTIVGDELFIDVSYEGLRGNISNAHIHGPADVNTGGGVLVGGVYPDLHLPGATGATGRFAGRLTVNPTQLSHIIDGLTYFNIHSAFAGGGEIRGQIVP